MSNENQAVIDSINNQKKAHEQCVTEIGFNAAENPEAYLKYLKEWLVSNNIDRVYVEAWGGGDSGEIHTLDIDTSNEVNLFKYCTLTRAYVLVVDDPEDSGELNYYSRVDWESFCLVPKQGCLSIAIEDMVYSIAESTGYDWYNNEGGGFELSFLDGKLCFRLSINVVITETPVDYEV